MKIRTRIEELGKVKNRSNSIIKEPFESFPENKLIMEITNLVSKWLKNIDKNQETFRKMKKSEEKLMNQSSIL